MGTITTSACHKVQWSKGRLNLQLLPRAGKEEDASGCHVLLHTKPHGLRRRHTEREREGKNGNELVELVCCQGNWQRGAPGDAKQVWQNFRLIVRRGSVNTYLSRIHSCAVMRRELFFGVSFVASFSCLEKGGGWLGADVRVALKSSSKVPHLLERPLIRANSEVRWNYLEKRSREGVKRKVLDCFLAVLSAVVLSSRAQ